MKRLIGFVFGLAALAIVALGIWEARADIIPLKPVAICDRDVCTMTKADYDKLVEFHQRVVKGVFEWEEREEQYQQAIAELQMIIRRRLLSCLDRRV